jgi:hypothetical protein
MDETSPKIGEVSPMCVKNRGQIVCPQGNALSQGHQKATKYIPFLNRREK